MGDRNDEEGVGRVGNTGESIVPGQEGGDDAKGAAGAQAARAGRAVLGLQVGDAQEEEGQVEGEKEQEEGDGGLERAEEEDRGEDEPALQKTELALQLGSFP